MEAVAFCRMLRTACRVNSFAQAAAQRHAFLKIILKSKSNATKI